MTAQGFNGTVLPLLEVIDSLACYSGQSGTAIRATARSDMAREVQSAVYEMTDSWRRSAEEFAHEEEPDLSEDRSIDGLIEHTEDRVTAEVMTRLATDLEVTLGLVDTESSASRQHHIETGRYLRPGEEIQ